MLPLSSPNEVILALELYDAVTYAAAYAPTVSHVPLRLQELVEIEDGIVFVASQRADLASDILKPFRVSFMVSYLILSSVTRMPIGALKNKKGCSKAALWVALCYSAIEHVHRDFKAKAHFGVFGFGPHGKAPY